MVKTTLKPTSRYIPSGDIELHALDWGGDGPPLITVHGGRRTANSWNAVATISYTYLTLPKKALGETPVDAVH